MRPTWQPIFSSISSFFFRRFRCFVDFSSTSSISFRRFRRFRLLFLFVDFVDSKNSTEKCLACSGKFGVNSSHCYLAVLSGPPNPLSSFPVFSPAFFHLRTFSGESPKSSPHYGEEIGRVRGDSTRAPHLWHESLGKVDGVGVKGCNQPPIPSFAPSGGGSEGSNGGCLR